MIIICSIGNITVNANLTFIKFINDITLLIQKDGGKEKNPEEEFNFRNYVHLFSNGLVNISWETSKIFFVDSEKEHVCVKWPLGRICTSGMSNLSTDVELPTLISLPIHLIQGIYYVYF
jgi:hypothetical protein